MSAKDNVESSAAVGEPEIVDPHNVPIAYVDWIVTGGVHDNVVNITLGTLDHAFERAGSGLRVVVAAQLRFSRGFAQQLHRALGEILGVQGLAITPPNQTAPKNTLN